MAHQHDDKDLSIETLDEQIAKLSQTAPHLLNQPDARLVKDLRNTYASAARVERKSLEHVLMRLHEKQYSSTGISSSENQQPASQTPWHDNRGDSAHTLSIQQLGNYRLLSLLDSGGFAHVYLAEQIYLQTLHAVKVLHMHLFDEEQQQGFLEEARMIAHLGHAHIVQVTDFGVEETVPFLVMSYAVNGNLRQRHPEGSRVPLDSVVHYVMQVARALQYAHDQHLVHRDIKPENLLLDANDNIMLSDFGIAIVAHSSHSQSLQNVVGTALYMSPEQLKGRPRPASDQYSLAVLAYEWLSGTRPFAGETYLDIARQHLQAPAPSLSERLPEISLAVATVIDRALAKEPQQRFASVQAFADALEQATLSGAMPALPPVTESRELERGIEKRREEFRERRQPSRRLVLALLGSVGALAAGGSYLGWRALSSGEVPPRVSPTRKASSPTPSSAGIGQTVFVYNGLNSGIDDVNNRYYIDALAWSPDSTRILSAGSPSATAFPDPGKLTVWHVSSGENILTDNIYEGPGDPQMYEQSRGPHASWSPDGKDIITMITEPGSNSIVGPTIDYGIHCLNASTGNVLLAFPANGSTLAWSSDGESIALLGHATDPHYSSSLATAKNRRIVILNASTADFLQDYDAEFLYNLDPPGSWQFSVLNLPLDVWAPTTRYLASFYYQSVNVWDILNRQLVSRYYADVSGSMKIALAWSPDERYVASGWGSEVHISSAQTGHHIFTYRGHNQTVNAITWSPDGSRLATGGDDQTVQVWETGSGKLLFTYRQHSDRVTDVAWSPDGVYLASGGAPTDGTVHIWKAQ